MSRIFLVIAFLGFFLVLLILYMAPSGVIEHDDSNYLQPCSYNLRGLDSSSTIVWRSRALALELSKDPTSLEVITTNNKLALLVGETVFPSHIPPGNYWEFMYSNTGLLAFGSLIVTSNSHSVVLSIPSQSSPSFIITDKDTNPSWSSTDGSTTIASGLGWKGLYWDGMYFTGCDGCGTSITLPASTIQISDIPETFQMTIQESTATSCSCRVIQGSRKDAALTLDGVDMTLEPLASSGLTFPSFACPILSIKSTDIAGCVALGNNVTCLGYVKNGITTVGFLL